MAWTTPLTAVANAALTAAQWNASVRDNLNETAVAKATTAGAFFAVSAANQIAERIPGNNTVTTGETTTSTSYTNLATVGPNLTVTTSIGALCILTTQVANSALAVASLMALDVSGASTLSPTDTWCLRWEPGNNGDAIQCSSVFFRTDLTAGSNTFTAKYKVESASTGTWANRRLSVIPF